MKKLLLLLLPGSLWLSAMAAAQAPPTNPPVTISLGARHGHVTPVRQGFNHTGAGNLDVTQPSPDIVVVTMTGVAVAGGHPCQASVATMNFDLEQCFEIVFEKPEVQRAKLTLEGRVIGLLRSHCKGGGSAELGPGTAFVTCGPAAILGLTVTPHSITGGENLSVNCRQGPAAVPVLAGTYSLHGKWAIAASHPKSLLPRKAASAEFAPDPGLDPSWISHWEPFHGVAKNDFGFQITIKVAPDNGEATEKSNP